MESLGVIKKVEESTDWCAGKVRICVDLTKLNQSVKRELHPLPAVDRPSPVSRSQSNEQAWHQFRFLADHLSPESAKLTTFITPYGRYCFHRLPFGISSAPNTSSEQCLTSWQVYQVWCGWWTTSWYMARRERNMTHIWETSSTDCKMQESPRGIAKQGEVPIRPDIFEVSWAHHWQWRNQTRP